MGNKVFISCAVTGSGDTSSKHPDLTKTQSTKTHTLFQDNQKQRPRPDRCCGVPPIRQQWQQIMQQRVNHHRGWKLLSLTCAAGAGMQSKKRENKMSVPYNKC